MAARSSGKPKVPPERRPSAKTGAGRQPSKTAARKAAATPKAAAKTPRKKSAAGARSGTDKQLLADQNKSLRAELEQAKARILKLEEANRNVLDRIDWVIDSLHSAIEAKR